MILAMICCFYWRLWTRSIRYTLMIQMLETRLAIDRDTVRTGATQHRRCPNSNQPRSFASMPHTLNASSRRDIICIHSVASPLMKPLSNSARQGVAFNSGPCKSGKLRVLRTWMPALCSPLKGVTSPGQPALAASAGELNHNPR